VVLTSLSPSCAIVALVRYYTQNTNQELSNGETEETGGEDLSPAQDSDEPPTQESSDEGRSVKTDSHREGVACIEAGLLEEVCRVIGKLEPAHDLTCPSDHGDLCTSQVGPSETVKERSS